MESDLGPLLLDINAISVKRFAKRSIIYSVKAFFVLIVIYLIIYFWIASNNGQKRHRGRHYPAPVSFAPDPDTGDRVIVLWTPFFGKKDYIPHLNQSDCPVQNCIFTSNRTWTKNADAIMFHIRDLNPKDLPFFRSGKQRWIMLHHESPSHTPIDTMKSMDGLFNWTITYRLDSDIVLQTFYRPKVHQNYNKTNNSMSEYDPMIDYSRNKTHLIAWFVSNCQTPSRREDFVQELMKSITVDVYGSCGPLRCQPKMSSKCYKSIEKTHRFYLSLENSICKDYVTEKFSNILHLKMIPIVLGGPDYSRIAPPKSFIDSSLFSTPKDLAKYLINLAKDPAEYNKYFEWKEKFELDYEHYSCSICRKLNDKSEPTKSWNNLNKWWFEDAGCKSWHKNRAEDDDDNAYSEADGQDSEDETSTN